MKKSIQDKIDAIIEQSKKSGYNKLASSNRSRVLAQNDSLSSAIRSEHDAEIFLSELNAAFKSGRNKL